MSAPTLVSTTQTSDWVSTGTSKLISSVSVQAGDVVVVQAATADAFSTQLSISGGLTWTLQKSGTTTNNCAVYAWTGTAASTGSITITLTRTSGTSWYGGIAKVWRGASGIGASAVVTDSSTARVSITTTGADSAVDIIGADWLATTGTRNWGSGTEDLYVDGSPHYTVFDGHWADSGVTGTYTVGTSTPTGMSATVIAVEILGGGSSGATGTAAITEGADSVSGTGSLSTSGTAAITEGADVVSATGTLSVSGTAAITEGSDSVSGTGIAGASGTASINEGTDTVSASGTLSVGGAAGITEGADVVAATGALESDGAAAIAEGADTVSASGTASSGASGSGAITEDIDAVAATGTLAVSGSAAIVEAADSAQGTGNNGEAVAAPAPAAGGGGGKLRGKKKRKDGPYMREGQVFGEQDPLSPFIGLNSARTPVQAGAPPRRSQRATQARRSRRPLIEAMLRELL